MEVAVSEPGRLFLPQEAASSRTYIEARSGKRHLGLLRLQEERCGGLDRAAHFNDCRHRGTHDRRASRGARGNEEARNSHLPADRGYSSIASVENNIGRWWWWRRS